MLKSMINLRNNGVRKVGPDLSGEKTNLVLGLMLIMLLAMSTSLMAQTSTPPSNYATSDGSSGDPYFITTLDNLYWLSQTSSDWDKYYIQTADINASATSGWNSGAGFSPIGNFTTTFTGSYDGQGHTIDGLTINRSGCIGLFGCTDGSTIKNLGVTNVNLSSGWDAAGALNGSNNSSSKVENCYSTGSVSGAYCVGGLVGENWNGSQVINCYSRCSVNASYDYHGGGLIGQSNSTVTNCYSTGTVTGTNAGGLMAYSSGTVSNSFWDTETSGQPSSAGGTGKTTAEMTTDALVYNYTTNIYLAGGWDFKGETTNGTNDIWNIGNSRNNGYPYFDWEYPSDPATLPVVLSTFTVQYLNNTPTLYWSTQSETDNIGWNVYRNTEEDFSSAQVITNELIPGNGTTTEPSYYNFSDKDNTLEIGTTYWYWLESVDLGGETHYSNSVSITIPAPGEEPSNIEPPVVYILNTVPNPMNSSTYFNFTLDKSVEAAISIYNIKGELVKILPKVWADADEKATVYWNGKDKNGNRLQSGIYFYKLLVNGKTYKTNKLILIH